MEAESRHLTFDELADMEPRLEDLRRMAGTFDPVHPDYNPNVVWSRLLKPGIDQLVGYGRIYKSGHSALRTPEAYDRACIEINRALPDHLEVA